MRLRLCGPVQPCRLHAVETSALNEADQAPAKLRFTRCRGYRGGSPKWLAITAGICRNSSAYCVPTLRAVRSSRLVGFAAGGASARCAGSLARGGHTLSVDRYRLLVHHRQIPGCNTPRRQVIVPGKNRTRWRLLKLPEGCEISPPAYETLIFRCGEANVRGMDSALPKDRWHATCAMTPTAVELADGILP